jgi:hypothetical protein
MSNLVTYAKEELTRAGLFDEDSDYNGMLGNAALEIIEVFAKQGHSGYSASVVTSLVEKLMRYEPLTPLTYAPDEWNDVSEESNTPMWQNRRKPTTFSLDGGKTHYDLDDPKAGDDK